MLLFLVASTVYDSDVEDIRFDRTGGGGVDGGGGGGGGGWRDLIPFGFPAGKVSGGGILCTAIIWTLCFFVVSLGSWGAGGRAFPRRFSSSFAPGNFGGDFALFGSRLSLPLTFEWSPGGGDFVTRCVPVLVNPGGTLGGGGGGGSFLLRILNQSSRNPRIYTVPPPNDTRVNSGKDPYLGTISNLWGWRNDTPPISSCRFVDDLV